MFLFMSFRSLPVFLVFFVIPWSFCSLPSLVFLAGFLVAPVLHHDAWHLLLPTAPPPRYLAGRATTLGEEGIPYLVDRVCRSVPRIARVCWHWPGAVGGAR